jgi:glyoxylase I family protein
MERVVGVGGIGGVLFKAHDADTVTGWYAEHRGVDAAPGGPTTYRCGDRSPGRRCSRRSARRARTWAPPGGVSAFGVVISRSSSSSVGAGGIGVEVDPADDLDGRVAQLGDPQANAIQLGAGIVLDEPAGPLLERCRSRHQAVRAGLWRATS